MSRCKGKGAGHRTEHKNRVNRQRSDGEHRGDRMVVTILSLDMNTLKHSETQVPQVSVTVLRGVNSFFREKGKWG